MEERIIDDDLNKNGDYSLEIPESDDENYNEDEVGLTPSQLEALEEERKRAQKEAEDARDKRIAQGKLALKSACYEEAAEHFLEALSYDPDSVDAGNGLIDARTRGFTDDEPYFVPRYAEEIAALNGACREYLRQNVGERLEAERAKIEEEMTPLAEAVEKAQKTRREAFTKNYKYYLVRVSAFVIAAVLFAAGALISATFITRTKSPTPVVLAVAFGVAALVLLVVMIPFVRKLVVAARLKNRNEDLDSTDEGARVEELQSRLDCLNLILDEE